jgi:hypothetical protein
MKGHVLTAVVGFIGVLSSVSACASHAHEEEASQSAAIVNGSPATTYPEAVLVDMHDVDGNGWACSGSVIAPQVVLTAGHCVYGMTGWVVTAPYAGGQRAYGSAGAVFDYTVRSETVDESKHDVGLIFLASPLSLDQYPIVAAAPVPNGTPVLNVGRIDNGAMSRTDLFVSPPVAARDGASVGWPNEYFVPTDEIQPGDSGGPDEIPNASPHRIVGVNSGRGDGYEGLARTDLVYAWIRSQIDAHGGGGSPDADPLSFDAGYYFAFYADLRAAFGGDTSAATQHWMTSGIQEGRQGSPLFAPKFYLGLYPDLRNAFGPTNFAAAVRHWRSSGLPEGRDGSPLFNAAYYLAAYADLRNAFGGDHAAAATHFMQYGIREGRHASPFLDVGFYLSMYDDLRNVFGGDHAAAVIHFVVNGEREGRMGTIAFDPVLYLATYGDLRNAFGGDHVAALQHWVASGIQEGRTGSAVFDSGYYLAHYPDLQAAFGSNRRAALEHYLISGINEGRRASTGFDPVYYLNNNSDVASACGGRRQFYCGAVHYVKYGQREGRRGAM